MARSIAAALLALALCGMVGFAAQETGGVGGLVEVSGEVHLVRGEQDVLKPTMEGGKVKNGELMSGDSVVCVEEGKAKIRLTDGSELSLSNGGFVSITQAAMPLADTMGEQSAKRLIAVKAGDVAWKIVPNKSIVTDFELPTGLVRVTGTAGSFTVKKEFEKEIAIKTIDEGEVFVVEMIGDKVYAHGTLVKGQSLEEGKSGSVIYLTALKGGQPFVFTLPNDAVIVLDPGESVAITISEQGNIKVESVKGDVEVQAPGKAPDVIPQGTTAEVGRPVAPPAPGYRPPQPWFAPSWPPERRRITGGVEEEPAPVIRRRRRIIASPSQ